LKIELVKTDGSVTEDANTVATVNNLLHSLFSSLTASLNGKPVSLHENNCHYKAYLETVLNYGSDASQTYLVTNFWFLDTPARDGSIKADATNKGYAKRLGYLKGGKLVVLVGTLHGDSFNSNNLLINGTDDNVKLTRSITSFYLLGPSADAKVRVEILNATLFFTQVELNPAALLAHAKVLSQKKA
jgi:hypothetical protein